MKTKITLLLLLITTIAVAQEYNSFMLEQIESHEKFSYEGVFELFDAQKVDAEIDQNYKLPWNSTLYTEADCKAILDTLAKNGAINIKEGSFSNHVLELNSHFPEFAKNNLMDNFKLSIKESNITNEDLNLKIQNSGTIFYGSNSSSVYKNGSTKLHRWRTLNATFNINTNINTEIYKGSVIFESGFVYGYDYVKIKKSDIGTKMKIGNYKFKVIDVMNNTVILDFKNNINLLDFDLINLNENEERLIATNGMSSGAKTLYKDIYQKFKENPSLSFDEYKKTFHSKFLDLIKSTDLSKEAKEKYLGKEYVAFSSSTKLENAYLYLPKHYSKTFKINLPDN